MQAMQHRKQYIDGGEIVGRAAGGDRQHPSMPARQKAELRAGRWCRQRVVLELAQQPESFARDEDRNGIVFRRVQRGHDIGRRKQRHVMLGGAPAEEHTNPKFFRGHRTTPPMIRVGARKRNTGHPLQPQ